MTRMIIGFLSGLLFGAGLLVSGMANPSKVQNFLDLTGAWDPSLAFVMAGGIGVALPFFWLARKMDKPVASEGFKLPSKIDADWRLVAGSAIFGIGWGVGGLCPGPAITSLGLFTVEAAVFVVCMLAGMRLARSV
ncbi:DUF6691 family protein [Flexibacterium corallicola]|uniref:DUF6691 family protein n=1 Tax=Flexibacterium corallicola TaxID=3037259 RepID=UPI00286F4933|nr:DUF6691 family protein [Pseudovibrio sp. M1P-2-3]